MSKDETEKENQCKQSNPKKKQYQPRLTFQTCDPIEETNGAQFSTTLMMENKIEEKSNFCERTQNKKQQYKNGTKFEKKKLKGQLANFY